ncbi:MULTISPECIES: cation transporter [unclassified Azospirillum]|uniref:cation transporter n=1 Tax=unclassified Azospirillum TaxID=2630922 RepID=UPI000B6454B0|nr:MULTISPECIES: cation diffusion facilitator family transporter [unclassified Azospirillum]SNR83352.1 cation diffusion facilitator family transporter [Azospirillum sp. RU38E]SNR98863.1 cation diffusion facilitator family transporter [Azospirillum sp. RU37A]
MSASCCPTPTHGPTSPAYRRVLWLALLINGGMFVFEMLAGLQSGSVALKADAADFLSDAANYGISLFVLGAALHVRSWAALVKGLSMGGIGLFVAVQSLLNVLGGRVPTAETMGWVGALALAANVGTAIMLYAWRQGDANMRSVWLCSRNDALGNIAVMAAALGVFGTGTGWPDIAVALVMAWLALSASWQISRQSIRELRTGQVEDHGHDHGHGHGHSH